MSFSDREILVTGVVQGELEPLDIQCMRQQMLRIQPATLHTLLLLILPAPPHEAQHGPGFDRLAIVQQHQLADLKHLFGGLKLLVRTSALRVVTGNGRLRVFSCPQIKTKEDRTLAVRSDDFQQMVGTLAYEIALLIVRLFFVARGVDELLTRQVCNQNGLPEGNGQL